MSGMFPYCYFGKLATESYEKICDCVFELNWRKLPLALQKYIVFMILNMQESLHYHGFHVATLDLNTYVNVSQSGNSDKCCSFYNQISDPHRTHYSLELFSLFFQLLKTVMSYYLMFKTIASK